MAEDEHHLLIGKYGSSLLSIVESPFYSLMELKRRTAS